VKPKDYLRIQQLEETYDPFRAVMGVVPPTGGWLRAAREGLGMSNAQLAKRVGLKAKQSIEDIQQSEPAGTAKLETLREVAAAMGCRLIYAIIPEKPLEELRRERATQIAKKNLGRSLHTMKLERQELAEAAKRRALERQVEKLLEGNPQRLWD
jgi:predicted DNA-binding mobile mystery protein A